MVNLKRYICNLGDKMDFSCQSCLPIGLDSSPQSLNFYHQQIGLFLAQTFLPQNFRAASVSAGFVKKICFFTHFLYFFVQWFLVSFVFKKQGFVNACWYFLNRRELDLQRRDHQFNFYSSSIFAFVNRSRSFLSISSTRFDFLSYSRTWSKYLINSSFFCFFRRINSSKILI